MIDDPEEEAWRELEKRIRRHPITMTQALEEWLQHPGPRTASDEEVRRHFCAGWASAMKNLREAND